MFSLVAKEGAQGWNVSIAVTSLSQNLMTFYVD